MWGFMKMGKGRSHPIFNVIYFFDGGKTRTFKVSSVTLKYSLFALTLLIYGQAWQEFCVFYR